MLSDFLKEHQQLIEDRTREAFLARSAPPAKEFDLARGIPIFMEQLVDTLAGKRDDDAIAATACDYGRRLFHLGFTAHELVHGYGSVCSVVTKLAGELGVEISTRDFEVFNRSLDVAIAEAVTGHEVEKTAQSEVRQSERIGALAHELRNALSAATMAFTVIKQGTVGMRGATSDVLERSLARMNGLVERSLAEVRLQTDPTLVRERIWLASAIHQAAATVRRDVSTRRLDLQIDVDRALQLETDEQFFISVVSNLLQNAVKYTREGGRVAVRGHRTGERIVIEVEDECGGFPPEKLAKLVQPFARGLHEQTGMGLGLSIAMRAIKALEGEIKVRDLPGKGCIFAVELPAALSPRS